MKTGSLDMPWYRTGVLFCECGCIHSYILQRVVAASQESKEEVESLRKSYSESCAEVKRLKSILHQAASAIRASLEVRMLLKHYRWLGPILPYLTEGT